MWYGPPSLHNVVCHLSCRFERVLFHDDPKTVQARLDVSKTQYIKVLGNVRIQRFKTSSGRHSA